MVTKIFPCVFFYKFYNIKFCIFLVNLHVCCVRWAEIALSFSRGSQIASFTLILILLALPPLSLVDRFINNILSFLLVSYIRLLLIDQPRHKKRKSANYIFHLKILLLSYNFLNFYLLIDEREAGKREEREREMDLLFRLFVHSLVDFYIYPDRMEPATLAYLNDALELTWTGLYHIISISSDILFQQCTLGRVITNAMFLAVQFQILITAFAVLVFWLQTTSSLTISTIQVCVQQMGGEMPGSCACYAIP